MEEKFIQKSKKKEKKEDGFYVRSFGISIDTLLEKKVIPVPNYIKIDVDGSEEDILKGSKKALAHNDCKSILIEVNDLISSSETEKFYLSVGLNVPLKIQKIKIKSGKNK